MSILINKGDRAIYGGEHIGSPVHIGDRACYWGPASSPDLERLGEAKRGVGGEAGGQSIK
ncbi:MAG: hypothetical protein FWG49_02160 [Leptospirales bacterium]|nr:hypothetical protein [Leptospirales bacterium]